MTGGRWLIRLSMGAALILSATPVRSQYPDPGQYVKIYSSKSESLPRVVRLARYLYGGGAAPPPVAFVDNANCEGGVDVIDVVYLVNWALRGGPAPCDWFGWYFDPADTRDAETIAMWESDEMTAPAELFQRVQHDLWRLRTLTGADQTALTCIHFTPRWYPSSISAMVDSVTYAAIQSGNYHAWDSLNALFGAHWGEFYHFDVAGPHFGSAYFDGIYNSRLLGELYDDLPGFLHAGEEMPSWSGEPYPQIVYPLVSGDTITYLFKMGWSYNGASGRHRYWYCATVPDSAWIVGDWDPRLEPQPWWWDQALANMEHFWEK